MSRVLKEPLLHFLLLGAALFGLSSIWGTDEPRAGNEILVTTGQVEHLSSGFERTWNRTPTEAETEALIEDYIREEVHYREALNLGLDRDDRVIRQRLKQKVQFLAEGLVQDIVPTDSTLQSFLNSQQDEFMSPPLAAFQQLYFNPDRRGDAAKDDALAALASLAGKSAADAAGLGDGFLMPTDVGLSTKGQISRMFGAEFSEEIFRIRAGSWVGPVLSGYGIHLVYVLEKKAGRPLVLREVRQKVLLDWQRQQREQVLEQAYVRLRERYTIVIERPAATAGAQQARIEEAP